MRLAMAIAASLVAVAAHAQQGPPPAIAVPRPRATPTPTTGRPSIAGRELAYKKHAEAIHQMRYRVQSKDKPATAADIAAFRPVADALGADLADPTVSWNEKRPTLQAIQWLRHAATPSVPALVQSLDAYPDDNGPQGVGHFCEVADAMAAVAPQDERNIRAVTEWLRTKAKNQSICHRCGCALRALEAAGPAARNIAGPMLEELSASRVLMSDDFQLGKTLKAIGISAALSQSLMDRVADDGVSTYDRAETLRALGNEARGIRDRSRLLDLCTGLLDHRDRNLREAAAETLGALGPPALEALRHGLRDRDYRVRTKSAASLARLGPAAAPAAPDLAVALDPFRGTTKDAIDALVAIGPRGVPTLEAHAASVPGWLGPLVRAAAEAARSGNPAPALQALGAFRRGPGDHGYIRVEERRRGRGHVYRPGQHRARIEVKGGAVGPGSEGLPRFDLEIDERFGPSLVFQALDGRREGDAVHVMLSPEIAQTPLFGTDRWNKEEKLKNAVPEGVAAAFDVEIGRVCQPVMWRPFPYGMFSDARYEVWCGTPDPEPES